MPDGEFAETSGAKNRRVDRENPGMHFIQWKNCPKPGGVPNGERRRRFGQGVQPPGKSCTVVPKQLCFCHTFPQHSDVPQHAEPHSSLRCTSSDERHHVHYGTPRSSFLEEVRVASVDLNLVTNDRRRGSYRETDKTTVSP